MYYDYFVLEFLILLLKYLWFIYIICNTVWFIYLVVGTKSFTIRFQVTMISFLQIQMGNQPAIEII